MLNDKKKNNEHTTQIGNNVLFEINTAMIHKPWSWCTEWMYITGKAYKQIIEKFFVLFTIVHVVSL